VYLKAVVVDTVVVDTVVDVADIEESDHKATVVDMVVDMVADKEVVVRTHYKVAVVMVQNRKMNRY
jgi:hypothetical protein